MTETPQPRRDRARRMALAVPLLAAKDMLDNLWRDVNNGEDTPDQLMAVYGALDQVQAAIRNELTGHLGELSAGGAELVSGSRPELPPGQSSIS